MILVFPDHTHFRLLGHVQLRFGIYRNLSLQFIMSTNKYTILFYDILNKSESGTPELFSIYIQNASQ